MSVKYEPSSEPLHTFAKWLIVWLRLGIEARPEAGFFRREVAVPPLHFRREVAVLPLHLQAISSGNAFNLTEFGLVNGFSVPNKFGSGLISLFIEA